MFVPKKIEELKNSLKSQSEENGPEMDTGTAKDILKYLEYLENRIESFEIDEYNFHMRVDVSEKGDC